MRPSGLGVPRSRAKGRARAGARLQTVLRQVQRCTRKTHAFPVRGGRTWTADRSQASPSPRDWRALALAGAGIHRACDRLSRQFGLPRRGEGRGAIRRRGHGIDVLCPNGPVRSRRVHDTDEASLRKPFDVHSGRAQIPQKRSTPAIWRRSWKRARPRGVGGALQRFGGTRSLPPRKAGPGFGK